MCTVNLSLLNLDTRERFTPHEVAVTTDDVSSSTILFNLTDNVTNYMLVAELTNGAGTEVSEAELYAIGKFSETVYSIEALNYGTHAVI